MLYRVILSTLTLLHLFALTHARALVGYVLTPAAPPACDMMETYSDPSEIALVAARACAAAIPGDLKVRDMTPVCDGQNCQTYDVGSDDIPAIDPVLGLNNIFGIESQPFTELAFNVPAGGGTDLSTQNFAGGGESLDQKNEIDLPVITSPGDTVANDRASPPPTFDAFGNDLTGTTLPSNTDDSPFTLDNSLEAVYVRAPKIQWVPQNPGDGRPDMHHCLGPANTEDNDLYVVHHAIFEGTRPQRTRWPHSIIVSNVLGEVDYKFTLVLNQAANVQRYVYQETNSRESRIFLDANGKPIRVYQWNLKGWLHSNPKEIAFEWFRTIAKSSVSSFSVGPPKMLPGTALDAPHETLAWVTRVFNTLNAAAAQQTDPYWISWESQQAQSCPAPSA